MLQRQDNLLKMGSTLSDTQFNTLIMSSLPESYWPILQTIMAAEQASSLTSTSTQRMKASDLIDFLIEEASHRIINHERAKNSDHALMASGKKGGKGKSKRKKDGDKGKTDESEIICYNCKKPGHKKFECWAKGGGKEGQGPGKKKSAKAQKAIVAVADSDKDKLFAFTCTSNYVNVPRLFKCRNPS